MLIFGCHTQDLHHLRRVQSLKGLRGGRSWTSLLRVTCSVSHYPSSQSVSELHRPPYLSSKLSAFRTTSDRAFSKTKVVGILDQGTQREAFCQHILSALAKWLIGEYMYRIYWYSQATNPLHSAYIIDTSDLDEHTPWPIAYNYEESSLQNSTSSRRPAR
jgi:hypothetical protein